MLSKVSVLLLGIIDEKPVNPYEITKLLEYINIKDWFTVAASSVYTTVKTLHEKGYIAGESRKEGNMPEKTIYSITEKGKVELHNSLIGYLRSTDLDPIKFNISSIMMCHIEREEVLSILEERLVELERFFQGINGQLKYLHTNRLVPDISLIAVKHNMYLIEVEIKTTKELISIVQDNNNWSHFVTKDIKI